MERLISFMNFIPVTHPISFQHLDINANSVNMERTLSLMNLQNFWYYPPSETSEFFYCQYKILELASPFACFIVLRLTPSHKLIK